MTNNHDLPEVGPLPAAAHPLAASVRAIEQSVSELAGKKRSDPNFSSAFPFIWGGIEGERDLSALSPELRAKMAAREAAGIDGNADTLRRMRSPAAAGLLLIFTLVFAVLIPATSDVPLESAGDWISLSLLSAVFFAAPCTLLLTHMWSNRDPLNFTDTEYAELSASRRIVEWERPGPGSWSDSVRNAPIGEPAAIANLAGQIVRQIETSPSWSSRYLDEHRLRLNLKEELFQIADSCMRLRNLDEQVATANSNDGDTESPVAQQLRASHDEYKNLAVEARNAIVLRVAALREYRERLAAVDAMLDNISRIDQLRLGSNDFADNFAAITRDTTAAEATKNLTDELAITKSQVQAELEFLAADVVNAPLLAQPLHLAR